ncbi:MAG: hypothetical protein O3A46_08840, partial [Candidatus Poribacteria bacterium]|nr:hypothetical protein [Candidatus Poribacteria bacterium]
MNVAQRILLLTMPILAVGCASGRADWYRIYDARAELDALRASAYVESVYAETQAATDLMQKAEAALEDDHLADVEQLSELVLLRVAYARAVAQQIEVAADLRTTEETLNTLASELDAQRQLLLAAETRLAQLNA